MHPQVNSVITRIASNPTRAPRQEWWTFSTEISAVDKGGVNCDPHNAYVRSLDFAMAYLIQ